MGVFPCALPRHNSDQAHQHVHPHSDTSTSSSGSSLHSLYSQPSLPSVRSLTPPEQPAPAAETQLLATLKGHSAAVFSLALDGKHLYSGSSDGEIRVCGWKDGYGDDSLVLVGKSDSSVKSMVVAGDKLFTAHHDHKIRVWKIDHDGVHKNYRCISTLPTLNDRCTRILWAKNYVNVRRNKMCTWVHHVDAVSAMALSSDGLSLYSVSWDRTLKIWRTSDYKCLESVQNAHDDAINAVALSPDGHIYTGSADRKIKVWKKLAGETKHSLIATLEKHKSAVNALALSADGSILYSGACDRSIVVWVKDGGAGGGHMVVSGALRGHTKAILCLTVVEDFVCSGSADKTVRIWRSTAGCYCCVAVLEGHNGPVKCLTAVPDEGLKSYVVYSGSLDFDLRVWKFSVPLT